jgi:hypothetical protein
MAKKPDPFDFVTEKGKTKMDSKSNAPNEINNPNASKTVGGKVEQGPNEGKTSTDPNDKKDPIGNVVEKDEIVDKEEKNEKGVTTLSSAVNQGALDKHNKIVGKIPESINMTQELTGSAGNVNLTQSGKLNSDKSVREDMSVTEQFDELNKITGPNPTPLRDGNESTKAQNGVTGSGLLAVDQNTNFMAEDLDKIVEKKTLNDEDRDVLRNMRDNLRLMGKF